MPVSVIQQDGLTVIKYREDKRPIKIDVFIVNSPERKNYLHQITAFIERASNSPAHVAKMGHPKFFALVERLSTTVCRHFSPTTNWRVTKAEIRAIVLFVLYAGIDAGSWPEHYEMTDATFVQSDVDEYE